MSKAPSPNPRRGEVWVVNFDPTIGSEIRKSRPAVVISSDAVGILPIKLAAPLTDWNPRFAPNVWHVRVDPDLGNGLIKPSAVDALQLRGMDTTRFVRRIGELSADKLEEIMLAIAAVIEYEG